MTIYFGKRAVDSERRVYVSALIYIMILEAICIEIPWAKLLSKDANSMDI